MFGKLMKYEMKSLSKNLLPLYGAVLVLALLNRIGTGSFLTSGGSMLMSLLYIVYSALCVAVAVLTIMAVVQRFYKGLLGDEGYLMHTLPVSPLQLVLSKLTGATLMVVLSLVVSMASLFFQMGVFRALWGQRWLEQFQGTGWVLFLVEFLVMMLFALTGTISQLYLSMALGHLSNSHRAAMSFVWYLVISVVLSLVSKAFVAVGLDVDAVGQLTTRFLETGDLAMGLNLAMGASALFSLVKAALFTFGTTWVLKNKLNLE